MIARRSLALVALVLAIGAAPAGAQRMAVDPNHPVRGSCGEVLQPLFATLRDAAVIGAQARMEVAVATTVDERDVRHAQARIVSQSNFEPASADRILAAFAQAYEGPEREGCVGVLTRRTNWVVRKGEVAALWLPDDPTTINRPVAATVTAAGDRIELIDPVLGFSRLRGPGDTASGPRCYVSSPLRDNGVPPPVAAMARGDRYIVRFKLGPAGNVETIRLPPGVTEGSPLAAALENFVRSARYYPQIGEDCAPKSAWLTIVSERP